MSDQPYQSDTQQHTSDDLRTRIAKVLDRHYYNNTLSMADAVIRELDMQVEYDDVPASVGYIKAHRYVTDWKADDE